MNGQQCSKAFRTADQLPVKMPATAPSPLANCLSKSSAISSNENFTKRTTQAVNYKLGNAEQIRISKIFTRSILEECWLETQYCQGLAAVDLTGSFAVKRCRQMFYEVIEQGGRMIDEQAQQSTFRNTALK